MSNFVDHARRELEYAGMLDRQNEYNYMVAEAVMQLVNVFAKQGHSGMSAGMTMDIFNLVARFKPLTPISSNPEEWTLVGKNVWQNSRRSTTFSRDGGKTWYDIEDETLNNGDIWKKEN